MCLFEKHLISFCVMDFVGNTNPTRINQSQGVAKDLLIYVELIELELRIRVTAVAFRPRAS